MKKLKITLVVTFAMFLAAAIGIIVLHSQKLALEKQLLDTRENLQITKANLQVAETNCVDLTTKLSEAEEICSELTEYIADNEELLQDSDEDSDIELNCVNGLTEEYRKWMSLKIILQSKRTKFLGYIEHDDVIYITFRISSGKFVLFPPETPVIYLESLPEPYDNLLSIPLDENLVYGGIDANGISYVNFNKKFYTLNIVEIDGQEYIGMLPKS